MPTPDNVLSELYAILESRKNADPQSSYVASLYAKGTDAILKKIAEEAGETIIAAKNADRNADTGAVVHELADLWFHTLVLMAQQNIPLSALSEELARRFGTSGHAEKAARAK